MFLMAFSSLFSNSSNENNYLVNREVVVIGNESSLSYTNFFSPEGDVEEEIVSLPSSDLVVPTMLPVRMVVVGSSRMGKWKKLFR